MTGRWISASVMAGAIVLVSTHAAATPLTADECASADEAAQNLRRAGEIRAARYKLLICVSKSCPTMVTSDCAERLNEVEKAIPTVVFAAKDATGNDLTAVAVTMDGAPLVDHLDGTSVAVDPGKHRFAFTTPGVTSFTKDLAIREGEKDRHESIVFGAGTATKGTPDVPTADEPGTGARWQTYAALGAGAVGLVGLVVGVTYTVITMNQKGALDFEQATATACNASTSCKNSPNAKTLQAADDAASSTYNADFAVTLVGYGFAVAAGIGTYLLLTSGTSGAPDRKSTSDLSITPWIGLRAAGIVGRF